MALCELIYNNFLRKLLAKGGYQQIIKEIAQ
jgi:hypothetical protein